MADEINIGNITTEEEVNIGEIKTDTVSGGTYDYEQLNNKPSINNVELVANKTLEELGIENYDDTKIKEEVKANSDSITNLKETKADKTDIPTKTSELTNDTNFIVDENYVHTDNNYTDTEKTKLAGLSNYDDTAINESITDLQTNKVDKDVNNLTNYYLKTEVDTQITEAIGDALNSTY